MPIITISRGSYSRGKEVAELVAKELAYECLSREVLIEASETFNVPEIKLIRAVHDAPSILERLNKSKQHYIAYIRAALLSHVRSGNVVYHGLGGHFFLSGVSHVLKVRVIANFEDRVAEEMRREQTPRENAARLLQLDDGERRKWSLSLYGADTADPHLYDMTLHIDTLTVPMAVELIVSASGMPCFQPTPDSMSLLMDLTIEAQANAILMDSNHEIEDITAKGGDLTVRARGSFAATARTSQEIAHLLRSIEGVKDMRIEVTPEG